MRICDLKNKEVINSTDCKILGFVIDVDIDIFTGKIIAIIVPGPGKLFGFLGRENEYIIPYECICKVGPDVILVNVCEEKILCKIQ
ncbi:MAG: PRC-barrel domain-containing protein [Butyrivibrio sp.]